MYKISKHRTICATTTLRGLPCRSWAVPGTNPPRCASHGGVPGRPGAPVGNQNAVTHGFFARSWNHHRISPNPALKSLLGVGGSEPLEEGISDIDRRQTIALITRHMLDKFLALSGIIDQQAEELPLPVLSQLLALLTQMAARLGRLLRDQHVLVPERDGISMAIEQAMIELSEILGTDLT